MIQLMIKRFKGLATKFMIKRLRTLIKYFMTIN